MSPEQQRLHALEIDKLATELEQTRAERDQLRQHILDIDAHATPYGDIPDDPGYVGVYLLTAGALHRALGKIGHTAPKCQAEAELAEARAELARCVERLDLDAWERLEAERDRLRAELERVTPVVEAAKAWRRWYPHYDSMFAPENALIAAVDVLGGELAAEHTTAIQPCQPIGCDNGYHLAGCQFAEIDAEPSGEADLDPNAPPIEAVLHVLGDVIAPDEPTGRTRCPLCKTLPIGHEGECEP